MEIATTAISTTSSRQITPEILSKIMLLSVDFGGSRAGSREALNLTHVSNLWRQAAFSTYSLWENIVFHPFQSYDLVDFQMALVPPQWPLKAIVYYHHTDMPMDERFITHADKWHSINVKGKIYYAALDGVEFPALKEIEWGEMTLWSEIGPGELQAVACRTFQHTASLRKVIIRDDIHVPDLGLPWANLTYLEVGMMEVGVCFGVLKACINLVQFIGKCEGVMPLRQQISLPALHNLKLGTDLLWSKSAHSNFFGSLSIPNLERLDLFVEDERHQEELRSLIFQSSKSLRSLKLDVVRWDISLEETLKFLMTLANLEDLELDLLNKLFSYRELLEQMTAEGIVPCLRSLKLTNVAQRDEPATSVIVGFVRARWSLERASSTLEKLSLLLMRPEPEMQDLVWMPKALEPLRTLSNAGFALEVAYPVYDSEILGKYRWIQMLS